MSIVRFKESYPTLFNRFFENDWFDWENPNYSTTNTTLPCLNIKESDNEFEVEVAAPGFSKEDFNVELNRDTLTVSSDKKVENEIKEGQQFTCREFSYQSFSRSFTLPNIADSEKIEAKYDSDILKITIPKKEEAKVKPTRQIAIS